MKPNASQTRGLPKFDTAGWLSTGVLFSAVLVALNLWSLIARWNEPFVPFQLGKILGMLVGIGLGVHCVDMMVYHRRNRSWGKMGKK